MPRFCIVTAAHVSVAPRPVKAADALAAAGHHVTVVALDQRADLAARDERLLATRSWHHAPVQARRGDRGSAQWMLCAAVQALAAASPAPLSAIPAIRDQAVSRYLLPLEHAIVLQRPDVIVAYTIEALPAAGRAAAKTGAALAFDVEDLHSGQLPDEMYDSPRARLVRRVESAWLPRCDLVTASSDPIAQLLMERLGIPRPFTILNSFPSLAAESVRQPRAVEPGGEPLRLYWFSQMIGERRGLEDAVDALGLAGGNVELHIRGDASASYLAGLLARAARNGSRDRVIIHAAGDPDELVPLASHYDVGLALEPGFSENNRLALSNKLLSYFAAGIPVIATDTPGQRAALDAVPNAGVLYRAGDIPALAAAIARWRDDRPSLAGAKRAAREAARARFSWAIEEPRLVQALGALA
ncbi:MAG: hypothetical protein JWO05_2018 [Gemmatimonadetes bacterium]|nr:hypothetical protein [Gemmatimonadota bacterium]